MIGESEQDAARAAAFDLARKSLGRGRLDQRGKGAARFRRRG